MGNGEIEIVLVEDNQSDAELIMRALRRQGLANKILHFVDGVQALEFLFSEGAGAHRAAIERAVHSDAANVTPKVILLDIKLPKVDGIEVLRRLKADKRTKEIPVVMLTSSKEERDLKEAYKLGANSFVTKPIKFQEFAKVVAELGLYWLLLNVPPAPA